ncbi:hypothetical protein CO046_04155 [Candidatus Peregrinibacteria bacterium CG_4_9_14_0_2_um_filter_53_11]|nr:MAG: hypothetical protein CO046_04155 [Candidatus Peregrinibacteria bacterium CG_4_9_14_0_2_um_filter_53_11]
MGAIRILSDTLISQIAAGEVVERPASVVKELIENSLDAGATAIDIELEQGGMKLIAVRDNGFGMSPEDAAMAFARHATSKINELEHLSKLMTFGFRGEAIAAITSVAHVTLKTRLADADDGTELSYQGGLRIFGGAVGMAPGTEFIVRNLFFNTPARKKFLKRESTELQHTVALITQTALANPMVAFSLSHNGRPIFRLSATDSAPERLAELLGPRFIKESLAVDFETPSIMVYGYVGQPGMTLSTKRHQYLFVNGRPVSDPMIARACMDAYGSRLPARTYPMFVLHVNVDPADVDVNVHPRKLTVKFVEQGKIYRDVSQAIRQALDSAPLFLGGVHAGTVRPQSAEEFYAADAEQAAATQLQALPRSEPLTQNAFSFGAPREAVGGMQPEASAVDFYEREKPAQNLERGPRPLAQLANSYILISDEEGIAVMDQHAAHERIMYERFRHQALSKEPEQQQLLVPLTLEFSHAEAVLFSELRIELEALGFEVDVWSGTTFVIQACPAALSRDALEPIVRKVLDELLGEKKTTEPLSERVLKSLACKAAVTFGMPLSIQEQQQLVEDLEKTPNRATCPHGRPTRVLLTFDELARRFYR